MRRNRRSSSALMQPLERRILLAADFARISHTGTLLVFGTSGSDQVVVPQPTISRFDGAQTTVAMNGTTMSIPGIADRIYVDAGSGDDVIVVQQTTRSTILGGSGNDTIVGGSGNDSLNGGDGNDWISGGGGDDTINGEMGNDSLLGGDGSNTADYGDRAAGFSFIIGRSENTGPVGIATSGSESDTFLDPFETIVGTEHADSFAKGTIWPGVGADVGMTFDGRGGNDSFSFTATLQTVRAVTCIGGAGNDEVVDQYGEDITITFFGGPGDDTAKIVNAIDDPPPVFNGGPGTDQVIEEGTPYRPPIDLSKMRSVENATIASGTLIGSDGPNVLSVAGGNAVVNGLGGDDLLTAGDSSYAVTLNGGSGNDVIYGTAFNDTLEGGGGADTLFGGDGNDVLAGNSGNDKIHGLFGNDTIVGGTGRDRLYGDDGDDLLLALDHQRDTVYGGAGMDSAYVDDSTKVKDLWGEIEKLLS